MSMHLEGPWLSTIGKRRGKQKFRNADQARKERELAESWQALQLKLKNETPKFSTAKSTNRIPQSANLVPKYPPGREPNRIPSKPDTVFVAAAKPVQMYTGDKIKGIGTLHKSNAVPVFSDEEAVEIATMRRN